jgi:hypothetical protein
MRIDETIRQCLKWVNWMSEFGAGDVPMASAKLFFLVVGSLPCSINQAWHENG